MARLRKSRTTCRYSLWATAATRRIFIAAPPVAAARRDRGPRSGRQTRLPATGERMGTEAVAEASCDIQSARRNHLRPLGHFHLQFVRRAQRNQFAAIDQPEPVAVFRLVHVMGRDEDRDALARQFVNQIPELAAADRIDAGGGLVEKHDRRLVQNGAAQGEPLPPAARQNRRQAVAMLGQARHLDHPLFSLPLLLRAGCSRCRCRSRCSPRRSGLGRARTSGSCSRCWP